jgi:outer membrane lipoprotein LolB
MPLLPILSSTPMPLFRLLVLSLLLAGCASTGTTTAPATKAAPMADLPVAPLRDSVSLSGRLTANYQKDGQPESVTVKFNWQQAAQRTDIELSSPFGQVLAVIAITPEQASLTESGKAPRLAPTIDALGEQALGWALPVAGLRQWLQGYATKQDGSRFVASRRFNTVETQDGWRLRYVEWQDEAAAVPVPRRIDAERINAAGAVEALAIRIVIDSWE